MQLSEGYQSEANCIRSLSRRGSPSHVLSTGCASNLHLLLLSKPTRLQTQKITTHLVLANGGAKRKDLDELEELTTRIVYLMLVDPLYSRGCQRWFVRRTQLSATRHSHTLPWHLNNSDENIIIPVCIGVATPASTCYIFVNGQTKIFDPLCLQERTCRHSASSQWQKLPLFPAFETAPDG